MVEREFVAYEPHYVTYTLFFTTEWPWKEMI